MQCAEHPADEPVGIYLSIPFCRAKCSFCNFASGVFTAGDLEGYSARLVEEIGQAFAWANRIEAHLPRTVDTIYLGGGTPSLLEPEVIARIFRSLREQFSIDPGAEVTVECAPLQLSPAALEAFQREGVNRLSFGVQSFVGLECSAVGRSHTASGCLAELERVAAAGIARVGLDLIAGLPHQTEASLRHSIDQAIASGVEHISLYLLEIDDDSRLGREVLAGGRRFGAAGVPDPDAVADWYAEACDQLDSAGVAQYEISNFARSGGQSRHNRRYWERRPYIGFGLDAHSMLRTPEGAVRWANPSEMERYLHGLARVAVAASAAAAEPAAWPRIVDRIDRRAELEESLFLGLRLVEGVDLAELTARFGAQLVAPIEAVMVDLAAAGFLLRHGDRTALTRRGREISNEVFERLLLDDAILLENQSHHPEAA